MAPGDLEHVVWRMGWGEPSAASVDALSDRNRQLLTDRLLPAGLATRVEYEECEALREAFSGLPGKGPDDWESLVMQAANLRTYTPRYLRSVHANTIIEYAESAVREAQ